MSATRVGRATESTGSRAAIGVGRLGSAIKPTSIFDVALLLVMLGRHQERTAWISGATKVTRAIEPTPLKVAIRAASLIPKTIIIHDDISLFTVQKLSLIAFY